MIDDEGSEARASRACSRSTTRWSCRSNKVVKLQVTAADVLHAFALPSFGIKIDAVPGRLNETWFKAEREGVYYGQCSELCGNGHPYMPIAIRVVERGRVRRLARRGEAEVRRDRRRRRRQARRERPLNGSKTRGPQRSRHGSRSPRRTTHDDHHTPTGWRRWLLLDQPQGHRHALPALRVLRGPRRRVPVDR